MKIEIGQRWKDKDKREANRVLQVVEIRDTKVAMSASAKSNAFKTFIRKDRLVKCWELVSMPAREL